MLSTRTFLLLGALGVTPWITGCRPTSPPDPAAAAGPPAAGSGQPSGGDGGLVSARVITVPPIGSLPLVDFDKKEINAGLLVVGAGAEDFVRHVHRRTGDGSDSIDATVPGEASLTYLPLTLGDIRGFRSRFHLYALGADEGLAHAIAEMAPRANGIIVVEKLAGDSDAVARIVARRREGPPVPVALVGAEGLARRWSELGGATPVFVGAAGEESVFPALKSVAKGVLTQLREGKP